MIRPFELPTGPAHVTVGIPDRDTLLAETGRRLAAGEGFALATINLDHIVKLKHDTAFRTAYQAHDLVVADGNPIVWLSKLAGTPVALVPGSDMVIPLTRQAADHGVPVALVGATGNVLAAAAERLRTEVPGLEIVAEIAPGLGFDPDGQEAAEIITALGTARPGLVFLALGAPRQERFAARARTAMPHIGFASIGASLDFLAGSQVRAPQWMRKLALEWVWRLVSSPRRLARRYLLCALILPGLALEVKRRARSQ